jgi:hypothetical protein
LGAWLDFYRRRVHCLEEIYSFGGQKHYSSAKNSSKVFDNLRSTIPLVLGDFGATEGEG